MLFPVAASNLAAAPVTEERTKRYASSIVDPTEHNYFVFVFMRCRRLQSSLLVRLGPMEPINDAELSFYRCIK